MSKAFAWAVICSLSFSPFTGEAWFFNAAQAQEEINTSGVPDSLQNIQTMGLLASSVEMTSTLKADNGSFIEIVDGQALDPEIGSAGTLADVIEGGENAPTSVYVVQPGDSVALVAKRFGISENTLRFANGMKKTDVLHRGEILLILPINGIKYTVQKGDNLNAIANKYKLGPEDFSEFLDYNNLEASSALKIGDTLIIPGVELAEVATTVKTTTKTPTKTTTATKTATTASTTKVTRGYFIKPVPCALSQGKHDTYAIDMACGRSGIPIKAAAEGKVVRAGEGWNGGYGNLVVIQHPNGMITFYAHMLAGSMKVAVGQTVSQGQVIGSIGSTGRSTGPHLHFEVRNGVNPGFDKTGSAWK